jgi:hypothetical protein
MPALASRRYYRWKEVTEQEQAGDQGARADGRPRQS